MAYEAKSFTFWVSYYDVAQELSAKEQGEFYKAIMDYMFTGIDPEDDLRKTVKISFKAIKANLKRSAANRRKNGNESDENRGEVPQSEIALNLNLNSNSKIKKREVGSRSDRPDPPSCPKCGSLMEYTAITEGSGRYKRQRADCPKCHEEVWLDAVI